MRLQPSSGCESGGLSKQDGRKRPSRCGSRIGVKGAKGVQEAQGVGGEKGMEVSVFSFIIGIIDFAVF